MVALSQAAVEAEADFAEDGASGDLTNVLAADDTVEGFQAVAPDLVRTAEAASAGRCAGEDRTDAPMDAGESMEKYPTAAPSLPKMRAIAAARFAER